MLYLSQVYNYEKLGVPFNHGQWWFFFRNNGLQNQSVRAELMMLLHADFVSWIFLRVQVLFKMKSLDDIATAEVSSRPVSGQWCLREAASFA